MGTTKEIVNRRASHEYHFLSNLEAGIVLGGAELKSIRAGQAGHDLTKSDNRFHTLAPASAARACVARCVIAAQSWRPISSAGAIHVPPTATTEDSLR